MKTSITTSIKFLTMYLTALIVLGCSVLLTSGQALPNRSPDPWCDYEQDVVPDKTYYIFYPRYSGHYPRGAYCRWYAKTTSNSKISLNCGNFSLPASKDCTEDRLSVSLTGKPEDFHKYCGTGTFSVESVRNYMLIELQAPYFTNGGYFYCSMTVVSPTPPPPSVCDCGWKNQARIVNGKETGINEYPMMAALVHKNFGLFCGSTIISNRYVLTAAHCLLNKYPADTAVLVGEHDITKADETNAVGLHRTQQFTAHPEYNSVSQVNDIAVVRLESFIIFNQLVGPVCLPIRFPDMPTPGQVITVLGWGTLEQAGRKSDVLMETQLGVINTKECQGVFGKERVSEKQICTFKNDTDACQADSGGPLLLEGADQRQRLVGIISYGKGCATSLPGVNTRVGSYIHWILSVTLDAEYCVR